MISGAYLFLPLLHSIRGGMSASAVMKKKLFRISEMEGVSYWLSIYCLRGWKDRNGSGFVFLGAKDVATMA